MKSFTVEHNLLEADRYVFPGCQSGKWHQPDLWPQGVKDILEKAGVLAKKYSLVLLEGSIDIEEDKTYLIIEAESSDDIQKFYSELGDEITFLKIKESEGCDKEVKQQLQSMKEILTAA